MSILIVEINSKDLYEKFFLEEKLVVKLEEIYFFSKDIFFTK